MELKLKLKSKFELTDKEIDEVISKFESLGYVDDERFKKMFVVSKLLAKEGPFLIEYKLKNKGIKISPEEIEVLAEKNDISIIENARELLNKKLKLLKKKYDKYEVKKNSLNFYTEKGMRAV